MLFCFKQKTAYGMRIRYWSSDVCSSDLFMYLLGLVASIGVAYLMKFIVGARERSYLLMEMPIYRAPRWSNVLLVMYERALAFIVQAGKVKIGRATGRERVCQYE